MEIIRYIKKLGEKDNITYITRIWNSLYPGLKERIQEPANNYTFEEQLTHFKRRAKTYCDKIIDDFRSYNQSFNKRILCVEFEGKLLEIKAIEAVNYIKKI